MNKEVTKLKLNSLVHGRFSKEELKNILVDCFGIDFGNLDKHFIDGKTFLDNEIVDDFYSFDLEIEKGTDIYANIYFIKTNEDLFYITEVSYEFNNWK